MYSFSPEQLSLISAARFTWTRRGTAKRTGLSFGEESITDVILMDLAEGYPGDIDIISFSKADEAKNGADWAWAFMNREETLIFPMLVQAKALDWKDLNYGGLDRKIGESDIRQIDRLIETADGLGWSAIYAFYNHLTNHRRIPDRCHSLRSVNINRPSETWGISFADARSVKSALDNKKPSDQSFDTHRYLSRPLHCLMCSGATGQRPSGGGPVAAYNGLRDLIFSNDATADSRREAFEPTHEIPWVFNMAQRMMDAENPEVRSQIESVITGEFPNLKGVVMLRDQYGPKKKRRGL